MTERSAGTERIELSLPFSGRWLVQNSPARRVPSHGTDLLGERYAIDFVGVDDRGRTAGIRDWHTLVGTEPADRFYSFGREVLSPIDGTVVSVHDAEPDHAARRSQLALLPYVLGQAQRLRQGIPAVAGNWIIVESRGAHIALVHLRRGSLLVAVGDRVSAGQTLAQCGNSGNSTQPHLHLQVMDSENLAVAKGLPMILLNFREWPRGAGSPIAHAAGMPAEGSHVAPLTQSPRAT